MRGTRGLMKVKRQFSEHEHGQSVSPSWKAQLERGDPLPPKFKLTEDLLEEMGVARDEVATVLQNLQKHKRKTWGNLLVLFEKGEEDVKREVGDEVSGETIWRFFNQYSAKRGGVVLPPSHDVTTSVLKSLLQDLDELPSLEDLNSILLRPTTTLIPVPTWLAEALFKKARVNQTFGTFKGTIGCVRASDSERTALEFVFHNLLALDVGRKVVDRTEDQMHQIYDIFFQQLLVKSLEFLGVRAKIDRNATEGPDKITTIRSGTKRSSSSRSVNSSSNKKSRTSSGKAISSVSFRPDLLVSVKSLLFLRGEEKRHGIALREAEADLIQKTLWCPAVMGRLPYTLAYAASGEKFRLYAIHPLPTTNNVSLRRLGRELDLTKTDDALELVGWVMQIARVMSRANADIVSKDVPPIGEVWKRVSGQYSKITIHETYVEKCLLENDDNRIQWGGEGGLKQLYDLIRAGNVTGTIKLQRVLKTRDEDDNREVAITLLLGPLGYRIVPLLEEIRDFLGDVLAALHSMHVNRWVHRDVKLKNVVRRSDGHWMLIDLEYAAKLDDTGSADWPWFDRAEYPMPERKDNERWRSEHDVKQVAIMLEQLDYFEQHPYRLDIIKILMAAETANVMDRLRPYLS